MLVIATLDGCDVSHYQGDTFPWQWLRDTYGCRFAACKISEGTTFIDSTGWHNRAAMKAAGYPYRGLYHYAKAGDPIGNAHHFQDQVGDLEPGEFVFPDSEAGMEPTVAAMMALLEAFETIWPDRVVDYRGKFFADGGSLAFDHWPWILAAYPWPIQVMPSAPRPVTVWQYAGGAHGVVVPGTRDLGAGPLPIGHVDSNKIVDEGRLRKVCGYVDGPPWTGEASDVWHVTRETANGEFWQIGLDARGELFARPFSKIPDGDYWKKLGPVSDIVAGPLKPVPAALLDAIVAANPDPVFLGAPSGGGVAPHGHEGGRTGGVIPLD